MDDRGLDEFKGEVDFDFFDDDSEGENKPKESTVLGKPPAARKSPKPPTPTKLPEPDLALDLKTSEKNEDQSDSDSYSSYTSDSSVTNTDSDSNSGVDRPGNHSGSKTKLSADSALEKNNKNKLNSRSASSSEDSTSKSYSESESDSESLSKVSSVQTSNDNKMRKHKDSKKFVSERDSASAYSDSHSDVESESKPVHVPSGSKSRERPMTSKNSRRNQNADAWTNGLEGSERKKDVERPSDKKSRKGRSKKERYSDSESEITDVSPLNSAPNSPRQKKRNKKYSTQYKSNGQAVSNEGSFNEPERLDLNVLVDAVSELDKDRKIKANTRRVMFAPPKAGEKKENFSYSNERAKMIEKENRRLLNEILQHVEMRDKPPQYMRYEKPVIRRLTPSAINREREQRKIENENLAFLKRLKNIKPTKGMSKAEHEKEYEKTMLYGVPILMAHGTRPKSRSCTPWDEISMTSSSRMGSRTRSLTSVHSAASSTMGSTQSTFRRPTSAKRSQRPEWNERW